MRSAASHVLGQCARYDIANVYNPAYSVACQASSVGRSRTSTPSRSHLDRDSAAAPTLATNGLKTKRRTRPLPRRDAQDTASFRTTSSAIASDDVSPGLSIPNSWTSPATPCSVGPSMRKSATEVARAAELRPYPAVGRRQCIFRQSRPVPTYRAFKRDDPARIDSVVDCIDPFDVRTEPRLPCQVDVK